MKATGLLELAMVDARVLTLSQFSSQAVERSGAYGRHTRKNGLLYTKLFRTHPILRKL